MKKLIGILSVLAFTSTLTTNVVSCFDVVPGKEVEVDVQPNPSEPNGQDDGHHLPESNVTYIDKFFFVILPTDTLDVIKKDFIVNSSIKELKSENILVFNDKDELVTNDNIKNVKEFSFSITGTNYKLDEMKIKVGFIDSGVNIITPEQVELARLHDKIEEYAIVDGSDKYISNKSNITNQIYTNRIINSLKYDDIDYVNNEFIHKDVSVNSLIPEEQDLFSGISRSTDGKTMNNTIQVKKGMSLSIAWNIITFDLSMKELNLKLTDLFDENALITKHEIFSQELSDNFDILLPWQITDNTNNEWMNQFIQYGGTIRTFIDSALEFKKEYIRDNQVFDINDITGTFVQTNDVIRITSLNHNLVAGHIDIKVVVKQPGVDSKDLKDFPMVTDTITLTEDDMRHYDNLYSHLNSWAGSSLFQQLILPIIKKYPEWQGAALTNQNLSLRNAQTNEIYYYGAGNVISNNYLHLNKTTTWDKILGVEMVLGSTDKGYDQLHGFSPKHIKFVAE